MSTIPTTRPRSKRPEVIRIASWAVPWADNEYRYRVFFEGNRRLDITAEVLDSPAKFSRAVLHSCGFPFNVASSVRLPIGTSPREVAVKWRRKVARLLREEEECARIESEWRARQSRSNGLRAIP